MPSFLSTRILTAAALLATASAAHAAGPTVTIKGSYTAVDSNPSSKSAGAPLINTTAGFLAGSFSEGLMAGSTTKPTAFLEVAPTSDGKATVTGTITVDLTLTDPSSVTKVTSSAGGNAASLTGGVVQVIANYAIDYGNSTDCISWTVAACILPSGKGTDTTNILGDSLAVTFADNLVLDVNLYNWSDWVMAPQITFSAVSGPIPEPMSIALLGVGMIGIRAVRRRRVKAPRATV